MFQSIKEKFQSFSAGRYGNDEFGRFIYIVTIVFLILSFLIGTIGTSIAFALLIYNLIRQFSRNFDVRTRENQAYLRIKGRVTGWFGGKRQRFSQRREFMFFKCCSCRNMLRVPRGKGKISVTCPKCGERAVKKS